jgi:hypothetical protein
MKNVLSSRGAFIALALAVLAGCGDPAGPTPKPFSVMLSVTVVNGNEADISAGMSGGEGVITSLTLAKNGAAAQPLNPGIRKIAELDWNTIYRLCGSAKRLSDGKTGEDCADFTVGPRPDRCFSPAADTVGTVEVTVEYIPTNPDPGASLDLMVGLNCDGTPFVTPGHSHTPYLQNGDRMSYMIRFRIKPNLPGGSRPIILRMPLAKLGKEVGNALPTNGTILVQDVVITSMSQPIPPATECPPTGGCTTAPGIAFNIDTQARASIFVSSAQATP